MDPAAAAVSGAYAAGLFSATCAAAKDLFSKRLSFRIDGATSTFASFAFALPFYLAALAILYATGRAATGSAILLGYVLARAVTDSLAEGLKMYAFAHGDISIVTTIFSMNPLFLLILSPVLTGDHLSWLGLGAMLLVTLGSLVLVYQPSSANWGSQKKAIALAATASVFFAINTCFDRLAMKGEKPPDPYDFWSPMLAGFTMTLVSALLVAPFVLLRKDRRASLTADWRGLWMRGFLEVVFMAAKLYAIRELKGPYVVGIMRLSVIFSIIGGWLFFKEGDFRRRLTAGVLIVAGVVLIAWIQAWEEEARLMPLIDPAAAVSPEP
jgi:drug/metabolite transporter (DMT)-like permease